MSQRIVDAFEAIEVEEHNRNPITAAERFLHFILEQNAIRQIGQCIMPGHVHDLGFGLPALRDILIGGDPTPVRSRTSTDMKRPGRC